MPRIPLGSGSDLRDLIIPRDTVNDTGRRVSVINPQDGFHDEKPPVRHKCVQRVIGDRTIFDPLEMPREDCSGSCVIPEHATVHDGGGVSQIQENCGAPVVGVVPVSIKECESLDKISPAAGFEMVAIISLPRSTKVRLTPSGATSRIPFFPKSSCFVLYVPPETLTVSPDAAASSPF